MKTIPDGTHVTWPYRSGTGHGVVVGIYKRLKSGRTEYDVRESDHHKGEKKTLHHWGDKLTKVSK